MNGIKTTGRIIGFETNNQGNKTPIIEFLTLQEEKIIRTPTIGSSSK